MLLCSTSLRLRQASRWSKIVLSRQLTTAAPTRPEGDISSVFPSLSGVESPPLPPRFADQKRRLIKRHEDSLTQSWHRLLKSLQYELRLLQAAGSSVIPDISYTDITQRNNLKTAAFKDAVRKRGAGIIRGVVEEQEALDWKESVKAYIRENPSTKGFPPENPAVYELYWTSSQIRARAHPNLILAQKFLSQIYHSSDPSALISNACPVAYADRLRIRQPGDSGFALGPHVDGGSVERWEENGYGGVYDAIFRGQWEEYDPWESSCRVPVRSDLYNSAGGCSMYRMFQGWVALSNIAPGEGHLKVLPLLQMATAYFLLRPFFNATIVKDPSSNCYLDSSNWSPEPVPTPTLQGAVPGAGQELNAVLHPHLDLNNSMTSVPSVKPGDYVVWHSDTVHAVDTTHNGSTDSSVLYIPTCPLTMSNAKYMARQRDSFWLGKPAPDFPGSGGVGPEYGSIWGSDREGAMWGLSTAVLGVEGRRGMGLEKWDEAETETHGEAEVVRQANKILGFE